MDFVVDRQDLLTALNFVRNAVERRCTLPILAHFLLEAEGFELRVSATDLELSARTSCQAKVKVNGGAVVPGLRFLEIVRSAASGDIRCRGLENHSVQVTAGRSSFKLVGLAERDFPGLPAIQGSKIRVDALALITCAGKTSFAVSEEESRYVLNGALLELRPDRVIMVATDGHRLAIAEHQGQIVGLEEECTALVPRRALLMLPRLVEKSGEGASISISKDSSHISFALGPRILVSRLLSGQFPNYESVLPKENGKVLDLSRQEFEDAIRRVSLLADDRVHGVRLILEKNRLEMLSSSPENGEASEFMEAAYEAEALNIGFNAEYLLDFLHVLNSPSVHIEMKDAESAVKFRPSGAEMAPYRYILMPLRF